MCRWWQNLGILRKAQDSRALGCLCPSFLSQSPTPLSLPVPKAQRILQRKELLSLFQLSPFCSSYLLNARGLLCYFLSAPTLQILLPAEKKNSFWSQSWSQGGGAKKGMTRELREGKLAHTHSLWKAEPVQPGLLDPLERKVVTLL